MLAPPGYAKITSTPSRSSASTRMSRPNIGGPTSARLWAVFSVRAAGRAAVFFSAFAVVLLIGLLVMRLAARIKAKTRDRCQPRVLVKSYINKHQRRRLLRRPAGRLVIRFSTFAVILAE